MVFVRAKEEEYYTEGDYGILAKKEEKLLDNISSAQQRIYILFFMRRSR